MGHFLNSVWVYLSFYSYNEKARIPVDLGNSNPVDLENSNKASNEANLHGMTSFLIRTARFSDVSSRTCSLRTTLSQYGLNFNGIF